MSLHPDPWSEEGMQAFAVQRDRWQRETKPLPLFDRHMRHRKNGWKNKNQNRIVLFSPNDRDQFRLPSQALFRDYCQELIRRYRLDTHGRPILPHRVCDLSKQPDGIFKLRLDDGRTLYAQTVVSAIGGCNLPKIPSVFSGNQDPRVVHALELARKVQRQGFNAVVRSSYQNKKILVVGGGLTSVHLCTQLLCQGGAKHVTLVSRKALKRQQYDVPLAWVSPNYRNAELSAFFAKRTLQEKWSHIQEARGGGTVTNEAMERLQRVSSPANFTLLEHTEIVAINSADSEEFDHCHSSSHKRLRVHLSIEDVVETDQIILATGMELNVSKEPLFANLVDQIPSGSVYKGLPVLDDNLQWHPDWDLFVMGGYAALTLGPMALNLSGGKRGASRLREVLLEKLLLGCTDEQEDESWLDVACHKENSFSVFDDSDSDNEEF